MQKQDDLTRPVCLVVALRETSVVPANTYVEICLHIYSYMYIHTDSHEYVYFYTNSYNCIRIDNI